MKKGIKIIVKNFTESKCDNIICNRDMKEMFVVKIGTKKKDLKAIARVMIKYNFNTLPF